jgi:hypothetical protein
MNLWTTLRFFVVLIILGGALFDISEAAETSPPSQQSDPTETEVDPDYR